MPPPSSPAPHGSAVMPASRPANGLKLSPKEWQRVKAFLGAVLEAVWPALPPPPMPPSYRGSPEAWARYWTTSGNMDDEQLEDAMDLAFNRAAKVRAAVRARQRRYPVRRYPLMVKQHCSRNGCVLLLVVETAVSNRKLLTFIAATVTDLFSLLRFCCCAANVIATCTATYTSPQQQF